MTAFSFRAAIAGAALLSAALLAGAATAPPAAAQSLSALSGEDRAALREEIRAYLLDNPEVIAEALQELERRRLAQALGGLEALIDDGQIISSAGDPNGDVVIVELTDYDCPYCRRAQPEINAFLAADPKVRHIVKALPYIGPDFAERAAVAARLTGDAEKTAAFHTAMMSRSDRLSEEAVLSLAGEVGLDADAIAADVTSPDVENVLGDTLNVARALEIQGTPAFIIGRTITEGQVIGGLRSADELAQIAADIRNGAR